MACHSIDVVDRLLLCIQQAVSSALANLRPAEREDIDLRVYVANTQPEVHPAWQSWLDNVIDEPFAASGSVPTPLWDRLLRLEGEEDFKNKGRLDYTVALERCWANSSAPYVAIFEGDILLAEGWFARTMTGLLNISKLAVQVDWLDLRLFGADVSIGWASRKLLGNNVLWISIGVALPTLGILIILRRQSQPVKPYLSNASLVVICCLAIPAFVILFFQAGKGSTVPVTQGVHRQETFGCCTQAQVFNRKHVPELVAHLRNEAMTLPYDMAITNFARSKLMARYALYPVIAQHLGMLSFICEEQLIASE